MSKENEAPCPCCGWPIAVYYDSTDSVGAHLAGYYLSHTPWVPYPKWTDCVLYKHIRSMPKFDAQKDAEAARSDLDDFERKAGDLWRAENPQQSVFDCDLETKRHYRQRALCGWTGSKSQ